MAAAAVHQDYTRQGGFAIQTGADEVIVPSVDVETDQPSVLKLHITAPKVGPSAELFPVVLLLNGFMISELYYRIYAERVSSYGYVVLQYDVSHPSPPKVALEYRYIELLFKMVAAKSSSPGDMLCGIVDVSTWATMGHSRGGAMAALQLAEYEFVKTACLLDPVDYESPFAIARLEGKHKTAAVIGCGIKCEECNPVACDYTKFQPVLGDGSWFQVIRKAGHAQVVDFPPDLAKKHDEQCGRGNITHAEAIGLALPPFVAWLEKTCRPASTQDLGQFFAWLKSNEESGRLTFWESHGDHTAPSTHVAASGRPMPPDPPA